MSLHALPDLATSEQFSREIDRLSARRVRMAEANEVLAKWGPVQGEPDLFKLGLSRAQVRRILPKTGPLGFAPAEIAALDGQIQRLREIVRQIRAASSMVEFRNGCEEARH